MAFNTLLVCAVLATAIYCTTAAPTTVMYNLLSDRSGLFVEAIGDGAVHARASSTAPAARFYVTWPSPGKFRFESVMYPGKYLLVDGGVLKVGVPSNDNDLFSATTIDTGTFAFHISPDCYMAFNTVGDPYGACGLTSSAPEAEITPRLVI